MKPYKGIGIPLFLEKNGKGKTGDPLRVAAQLVVAGDAFPW
jgi:hypothetical protein